MVRVFLKPDLKNRVKNGHPWIYENEIDRIEGDFENGDIAMVFFHSGDFLGKGYLNTRSRITVRLLTRKNEEIDSEFFKRRLRKILEWKVPLIHDTNAFRVIFSEADGIPGLTVDKYADHLVIQIGTLGIDRLKMEILRALIDVLKPKGIYEKSDYSGREKEGLKPFRGWVYGTGPELLEFEMNGLRFLADTKGQKTGAFLDQRINATLLRDFASVKRALDVFSYTGNFSAHLLKYGTDHVTLIDYSERALEIAREILNRNGFKGRYDLILGNAFDELRKLHKSGEKYDLIVLDPPAFAKSFDDKKSAYRGYKEINLRSMKIMHDGGILATSSCSRVVSEADFLVVLYDSAADSKVKLRILKRGGQPPDHTPVLNIFETFYLKFLITRVERGG